MKNTKYFKNIEVEDNLFYVDIGNKTVIIKREKVGIEVNIHQKKKNDFLGEPIRDTFAFFSE